jgi:hypothetical protein
MDKKIKKELYSKGGYVFKKIQVNPHLYSGKEATITGSSKEVILGTEQTWPDLLDCFVSFLRAQGFVIPQGDIEIIGPDEVVAHKTEALLFSREKPKKKANDV